MCQNNINLTAYYGYRMNRKSLFFQELWIHLRNNIDILVLRNYEEFPKNLGNDIDCLVMKNSIVDVSTICREVSTNFNFRIVKSIQMNNNLLSFYFSDNCNPLDIVKVDFFSGLSKGWLSYADTQEVLNKKIKFREYYVPDLTHEAYLLLMKELWMYGRLRDKYIEKFTSQYKDIDFNEVYKLSGGLITSLSIEKIEDEYSNIANLVLKPRPTMKNILQPIMAINWLYYTTRYRLLSLRSRGKK
jgi:hypothetical protein